MYKKVMLFLLKFFILLEVLFLYLSTLIPQNLNQELYYNMFSSAVVKYIFIFQLNNYYSSRVHFLILCCIIILLILAALKYIKNIGVLLIVVLLFFIGVIIFFDRVYNKRVLFSIVESDSINFGKIVNSDKNKYNFYLKLLNIELRDFKGIKREIAFLKKGEDTLSIYPGRSISIDGYKVYMQNFQKLKQFRVEVDSNELLCFKDTIYNINKLRFLVHDYIDNDKKLLVTINDKELELPLNTAIKFDNIKVKFVEFLGEKYLLKMKVVQNRFLDFLFILSFLYIFSLAFLLIRRLDDRYV